MVMSARRLAWYRLVKIGGLSTSGTTELTRDRWIVPPKDRLGLASCRAATISTLNAERQASTRYCRNSIPPPRTPGVISGDPVQRDVFMGVTSLAAGLRQSHDVVAPSRRAPN